MLERTLVVVKPDGVQRGLVGRILQRFEDAGLKIVAMRMDHIDAAFASEHYGDLGERKGENVKRQMVEMLSSAPVIALVLEGISAVENVRKIVGSTEPKSSAPGTIRGDFAQVSYAYADAKNVGIKNLLHASGDMPDALREVPLWFKDEEIRSYRSVHDAHILE